MSKRDLLGPFELAEERLSGLEYKAWLIDLVRMRQHRQLFDMLHDIEFTWVHPFDENRAEEGIALRYRFTQDEFDSAGRNRYGHPYLSSMDDIPCSVMEMLIALAISIEDSIMYDPAKGDRTHIWLWMMLRNLGLDKFSDEFLSRLSDRSFNHIRNTVNKTVSTLLDRTYDYSGYGGLFPLRNPRTDQRDEEIWYQANVYAIEELGL